MDFHHIPVLFDEIIELLDCKPGHTIVDGTLGGGGHAQAVLERILPGGTLIGIDRDPDALEAASRRLHKYKDSLITVHDNFANLDSVLDKLGIAAIDGMIMDLGVSSHQLDKGSRGFSYQSDAPLDMRMDPTQTLNAHEIVNTYDERRLAKIISQYGEERWAVRIAKFIVDKRPINTTRELTEVIKAAIPAKARRQGPHPSKRTFQAIRIEVNKELEILEGAIERAVTMLKPGGRLCIITFHSLEDRIVKNAFIELSKDCICPREFPVCICDKEKEIEIITRKPIIPTKSEISGNPRSRSAKLRIGMRV